MLFNTCKTLLLSAVVSCAGLHAAHAQSGVEESDTSSLPPAPHWALGINAGIALPYTDVNDKSVAPVFGIGASYYAAPFLHFNLDAQKGWLKSGADVGAAHEGEMGSKNSYFAAALTARFLPFGLLKNARKASAGLNILSGLYGGIGIGIMASSVRSNSINATYFGSLGDYSGTSLIMPVEAGINIPVLLMTHGRRLLLNGNVRANLCFSDKVDGYIPTVDANKKKDAFDTFTLGLVYNF